MTEQDQLEIFASILIGIALGLWTWTAILRLIIQ